MPPMNVFVLSRVWGRTDEQQIMNHKRKKAKHQRAGCIMCKPWKSEHGSYSPPIARLGTRKYRTSERRQIQVGRDER